MAAPQRVHTTHAITALRAIVFSGLSKNLGPAPDGVNRAARVKCCADDTPADPQLRPSPGALFARPAARLRGAVAGLRRPLCARHARPRGAIRARGAGG